MVNFIEMNRRAKEYLEEVGMGNVSPATPMKRLSTSQMQMVEIAKALSYNSEIIIMDEPTSSITESEVDNLFDIIRKLKAEGRCIIYISHKMSELFEIGDVITVFRDGLQVGDFSIEEVDEAKLLNEVAFFTDKANVDEEITRLKSHFVQAENILNKEQLVGRKLDFLVQEFNRETNTICSKSNDLELTNVALLMKSEIEKIREQIQNLE